MFVNCKYSRDFALCARCIWADKIQAYAAVSQNMMPYIMYINVIKH